MGISLSGTTTKLITVSKFEIHKSRKGLDIFEEEDDKLFFGREKLVDDLVNRVCAGDWLTT